MTVLNGKAYMITWLNQSGFIYDAHTLKELDKFSYAGEGWGLTNDGKNLIMSNGSNVLSVIDPKTFAVVRSISVTQSGSLVSQLNELEWIEGEIWANIWQSDRIVRIDPSSGKVTGVIDLTGILPNSSRNATTDVLNGIAYDSAAKAIYVTGKNWPSMFQIRVQ
jgi:glutamine cyclotransferase